MSAYIPYILPAWVEMNIGSVTSRHVSRLDHFWRPAKSSARVAMMRPTPCAMTPLGPRVARRCPAPGRHAVEAAALPPACQATSRRAPREPHPPGTPRTRPKAVPASSSTAQVQGAAGGGTTGVPSGVPSPPATDAPVLAWVLAPTETGFDAGASRGESRRLVWLRRCQEG